MCARGLLPRANRIPAVAGAACRLSFAALDADVHFALEIHEASNGILFAIDFGDDLLKIRARGALDAPKAP